LIGFAAIACGEDAPPAQSGGSGGGVTAAPYGQPWPTLAEWNLFTDAPAQLPERNVVPYDVIAQLYADDALKHRFLHVPDGEKIGYDPELRWVFPRGSTLVKTFSFPRDARDTSLGEQLLETRLLIFGPDGWESETYVWDAAQTTATLEDEGATLDVSWIDGAGTEQRQQYGVPTSEQCADCHGILPSTSPLGARTRQLDRDFDYGGVTENQIDHLAARGWLEGVPAGGARRHLVDPFGTGPLGDRARSYLDANCGHCHTTVGGATESGLLLTWNDTDPTEGASWGICKQPIADRAEPCGLTYDVVPGSPDQSILICRVNSRQVDVQMPELGSKLVDARGVALLRDWIAGLTPPGCP
jgi:uncharacterized repeat protein (TIGR03806 family)